MRILVFGVFFFSSRRRHTRWPRDWSSDVCSSDLMTVPVNDAGEYQVLALIPGTYSVKASADGFESVLRDNIILHVQDRLSIEFTLKAGSVNQQAVVTTGEPPLQTQTAERANVVEW